MKHFERYTRSYFLPPEHNLGWLKKDHIETAPHWCSVDLRDANQALVVPMSLQEKLEFFELLVKLGFKEIEVGFPAASETEFEFVRTLITQDLIPDDVTIQVITQARPHIMERTFRSIEGAKQAIFHVYNPISVAQRQQVFERSREEVKEIAVNAAKYFKELSRDFPGKLTYSYCPESFSGAEPAYALEVCNAVLNIIEPTKENPAIINLPTTVSVAMPHIFASQVAYMSRNLLSRENVILSVHPHNDRGTAVAEAEMALLAGAERVEGTLFGGGERAGNVDLITLALNLYSQGIDPELDLSDIPAIVPLFEKLTHMRVSPRQPYSGRLVFAAFSGSHQDAIAKGLKWRESHPDALWNVPYLPIDPADIGRSYNADVIRINSQSGKGGIGYLMEVRYGYDLPPKMREDFGYRVKDVSDREQKELHPDEIMALFHKTYVNVEAPYKLLDCQFMGRRKLSASLELCDKDGKEYTITGEGNGRLSAAANAISEKLGIAFDNLVYTEHALDEGSNSQALAYVGITVPSGEVVWGAGIDDDIIVASVKALFSACNRIE